MMSGLPELGFNVFSTILASVLIWVLIYFWRKSEETIRQVLADSFLGTIVTRFDNKVREIFRRKLFKLEKEQLVDFIERNPKLIEPQFQVIERDCQRMCNGRLLEPEICGEDSKGNKSFVFVKKEFDIVKKDGWLEMVSYHAHSDIRVIIAAISYPNGIRDAQRPGISYVCRSR